MTTNTNRFDAAGVAAALPEKWYVRRGHIMTAFRLTKEDMQLLVVDGRKLNAEQKAAATEQGRFVAEYLSDDVRARFVRARCLRVAQVLEGAK